MMNNVWTQDLAAMGRLVGIPYFFTDEAHEEEKHDSYLLRRVKGDKEKGGWKHVEESSEASSEESSSESEGEDPYKALQVKIALRIQGQFQGRVIRRHKQSLDWEGKVILPLPGYIEKTLLLKLADHEMEIIQELADQVKEK